MVFLRLKEKIGEFRTEKLDFQKEGPLTPKTAVWEMHMAHFTKSGDSNPQTFKKTGSTSIVGVEKKQIISSSVGRIPGTAFMRGKTGCVF